MGTLRLRDSNGRCLLRPPDPPADWPLSSSAKRRSSSRACLIRLSLSRVCRAAASVASGGVDPRLELPRDALVRGVEAEDAGSLPEALRWRVEGGADVGAGAVPAESRDSRWDLGSVIPPADMAATAAETAPMTAAAALPPLLEPPPRMSRDWESRLDIGWDIGCPPVET